MNQPDPSEATTVEVIYHADPLCGWCFAIADELATARRQLGPDVRWTLRMGGLVVGDRVRPIGEDADYLRHGLAQVAQVSCRFASDRYLDDVVDVGTGGQQVRTRLPSGPRRDRTGRRRRRVRSVAPPV